MDWPWIITEKKEIEINKVFDELLSRISQISIALWNQPHPHIGLEEKYDCTLSGAPSVGETEYAFFWWNCAILTAFRNVKGLSEEDQFNRNLNRNKELKSLLRQVGLSPRSVPGRYREAHWIRIMEEICYFVPNLDDSGNERSSDAQIRDFFRSVYLLAEHYEQDSFLFTFPGMNRVAFLIATNDNARKEFRGNLKFAGPLFTHVPNIGAWTECRDGKISFKLKGMICKDVFGDKRVLVGEGDIFDVQGYHPDGIIIIRRSRQKDLKDSCKQYKDEVPLIERVLPTGILSKVTLQRVINQSLADITQLKCQRIAIHCSASIGGSFIKGAKIALDTVRAWSQSHRRRFREIVMVDIYGEYSRVLAMEKESR